MSSESVIVPDHTWLAEVDKLIGEDVEVCYQCKTCSSGCPVSFAMDIQPNQIIHMIRMGLKDEWLKIDIQLIFNKNTNVWRFPVETISQSEGGFERVYQSSVVIPNWKIHLYPLGEWIVEINQKIIDL